MSAQLKNFDLNLLRVFVAVDAHRQITLAAKSLGVTQPALSHALNRLRRRLGDPLFVKTSRGMAPTPRAEKISGPIRSLLGGFEAALFDTEAFEPKAMARTFRIHTTDLIESLLLPELLAVLERDAPRAQVAVRPSGFSLPRAELETGQADLAIAGFFGKLPDGFYQQTLCSDTFLSAVRRDHPRLGKRRRVSLDEFCRERHVLLAPGGELHAKVDTLLKAQERTRTVAAGIAAFMSAAWIAPKTDAIFTGPSRWIALLSGAFPLHTFAPPVAIPSITIVQAWHARQHQDPGHRWLREHIRKILQRKS